MRWTQLGRTWMQVHEHLHKHPRQVHTNNVCLEQNCCDPACLTHTLGSRTRAIVGMQMPSDCIRAHM